MKLWSAILNAKSNQKSLAVAWDVLANAFGSVNHKLIHLELQQHNAPAQLCEIVANFYSDLSIYNSCDSKFEVRPF